MGLFSKLGRRLSSIFSLRTLIVLSFITTGLLINDYQTIYKFVAKKRNSVIGYYHTRDASLVVQNETNNESPNEIPACVHQTLNVSDPVMMKFFKKYPKISCKGEENWVYVKNGTIRFSEHAKQRRGNFQCSYLPLIRGPGDYKVSYGIPIVNITDGAPLVSDFFKISCKDSKNNTYENIHAGIHVNTTIKERLRATKPRANGLGLSIAFLGFDSMSRMSWLRRMPKTRDYLVAELKAIELEGYNILGDGTPAALFPILTGKQEHELPEARRNFKGAKSVDNFPWLWKEFSRNGYVTSWAEAEPIISPFNFRLLGFEHSPADYFMRPFYLAVNPLYKKYSPYCHASQPKHMVWFDWIRDIFYMYKNDPKFLIHFYTALSHSDNNLITMADEDLKTFISSLENGGFLNNTLLLVMADHGARFSQVRRTVSGKLEERLPYVSLRFPPWFEAKYPHLIKNVRTNINRLTTPFDLHETFKDFIRFDGAGLGDLTHRGISLFKEIPASRTCEHAAVGAHWCACGTWTNVSRSDPDAERALQTALESINNFTEPYRSDCALLMVNKVNMLAKKSFPEKTMYQLTFSTQPGNGEFEITSEHILASNTMNTVKKAVSRLTKYGDDPSCVLEKNREIRQYCYCNSNLKGSLS
ncbi:hypothetical protein BsWGS_20168 [Bradybaena similaris]